MSDYIDLEVIEELRDIMEDDFPLLIETFLLETERQYLDAKNAWQDLQFDNLRRSAHSLKGSAGNLGAFQLRDMCEELEQQAQNESADPLEDLMRGIDMQLQAVCSVVKTL